MKQKGIVSIAIIGIVILFLIAVGGFGYYLIDKNKKQKEDNQNIQQNQELKIKNNQVGKNQEKNQKVYPDKMTDEEAKEYFHATEIGNNNLPKAITFWTEAYCPGMGIVYEYIIPEGFKLHRCVNYEQEKGTHGGCPTCAMVKISLKTTEYKEKEEKATFIDGDHNITYSREWDIASQELTDDIFYSNEKLIEYIIASYDLAGLELDQKIQRGKFDVMNNNDVVLINLISSLMERDYFYVIEKGEKYSVLSFIYSTHHIGTTIDVIPNYFINNGKPFFIAYNGNATTGGCVTINENMLLYRIYNGVPKEVFSFPRYLMEDEREFNSIYYKQSRDGLLVISGHSNSFAGLCCNDFCDNPNEAIKEDIFKVFQWNEEEQIFNLASQSIINSKYSEMILSKDIDDIKFYFNAKDIVSNNLPESITFITYFNNGGCEEYIVPKNYKIYNCLSDERHDYITITLIKEQ